MGKEMLKLGVYIIVYGASFLLADKVTGFISKAINKI